ncbi:MAG TPA: hypothetical protein VLE89_06145 [Chlamydiales bacterium]|nr:hypothetical protein [Chlamydiales bacterium]
MASLASVSFCIKQDQSVPKTEKEEFSYAFFQLPPRIPHPIQQAPEALAKKFQGIEKLIPKDLPVNEPVEITALFPNFQNAPCYIPTLASLKAKIDKYQQKYGIEILLVSEKNAAETICKLSSIDDCAPRGMIIYKENGYHVTPVLFYRTNLESKWSVLMMDCIESESVLEEILSQLTKFKPDIDLFLSYGTRLGDRHSCRIEAITLLKYALHWAMRRPHQVLTELLRHKKARTEDRKIFFRVPRQWAIGNQIKDSVQNGRELDSDVINHKGETYPQWLKRHPLQSMNVQISINNAAIQTQKPMNTYLHQKILRWISPT